MNIKQMAIDEITSRLGNMSSKQVNAIKVMINQFPAGTEKAQKTEKPIKPGDKVMSSKQFTFKIDNIDFFVPTKNAMKKFVVDVSVFRFNKNGLLLYSGRETSNYVDKIAKVYGIDADKIILPTQDQTEQIYNNPKYEKYKNALLEAEIYWIPFIIDKNDENRNVSLKEFWQNPDNFCFCDRHIAHGDWDVWNVHNADSDRSASALLLGLSDSTLYR